MSFIRAKRFGDKVDYYLVENKREGKKVRQKVLKYLGTNIPADIELARKAKGGEKE